ncbi:DNA polymerase III subunit epsilon, partial [Neisseria sp. P0014.S009]
ALIDCELLGDVYLALTRQQFDLMGSETEEEGEVNQTVIVETNRTSKLKVIKANADELAAHEQYLDDLGKACVWRKAETPEEANAGASA